jgi:hypothetical protein
MINGEWKEGSGVTLHSPLIGLQFDLSFPFVALRELRAFVVRPPAERHLPAHFPLAFPA